VAGGTVASGRASQPEWSHGAVWSRRSSRTNDQRSCQSSGGVNGSDVTVVALFRLDFAAFFSLLVWLCSGCDGPGDVGAGGGGVTRTTGVLAEAVFFVVRFFFLGVISVAVARRELLLLLLMIVGAVSGKEGVTSAASAFAAVVLVRFFCLGIVTVATGFSLEFRTTASSLGEDRDENNATGFILLVAGTMAASWRGSIA
jgi:hypothetical protein